MNDIREEIVFLCNKKTIFNIFKSIEEYPIFLPSISKVTILESVRDQQKVEFYIKEVLLSGEIKLNFTFHEYDKIEFYLIEGIFDILQGEVFFYNDNNTTTVIFSLKYSFKSSFLNTMVKNILQNKIHSFIKAIRDKASI